MGVLAVQYIAFGAVDGHGAFDHSDHVDDAPHYQTLHPDQGIPQENLPLVGQVRSKNNEK